MIDMASHIPFSKLPKEVQEVVKKCNIDNLLDKEVDLSILKKYNIGMAANMECYDNSKMRVLPSLMFKFYNKRKEFKAIMKEHEKDYIALEEKGDLGEEYKMHKLLAGQNDTFQHAIKILINSVYGAICNQYFKYFKFELGESITTTGQLVNRWVGKAVEEFIKNEVLEGKKPTENIITYGDTDSIFFSMVDVINKFGMQNESDEVITKFIDDFMEDVLQPVITKSTEDLKDYLNAYENKMFWERENIYKSLIMVSKKRYAMKQMDKEGISYVNNPKYKIMGLESVRSSTPKWSQQWLVDSYKIALNEEESSIHDYVLECEKKFYTFDLNSIAIPTGVNGLDKYSDIEKIYTKGTPKHVKAALIHNHLIDLKGALHHEKIKSGTKIKYLELKKVNPINQEVIGFSTYLPEEFGLENSIDKEAMFEKGYIKPLQNFLDVIGWNSKTVNKIDNYFSFD